MQPGGYDTPEDAAMEGFPPKYCRVLASAIEGDDALVVLETGSDDYPYSYTVWCHRSDGRWHERSSSSGEGIQWTGASEDSPGTGALCGGAVPGADAVVVQWNGIQKEVPVRNGAYVALWQDVLAPENVGVVSFKVNGVWDPPSLLDAQGRLL